MSARSLLAAATVTLASLFAVPAAHATLLDLASCPSPSPQQAFAPWLDPAAYVLVPDGAFEAKGKDWRLAGASVGAGNEPFYVHSPGDKRSLSVPPGATATSPVMCISADRPTLRFLARGPALGSLRVDVLFAGPDGTVQELPVGAVLGGGAWGPSLPMTVLANLVATVDGRLPAAFRFTATGGAWQIDDVYVDPYVRH
jgi:hypothetical protein